MTDLLGVAGYCGVSDHPRPRKTTNPWVWGVCVRTMARHSILLFELIQAWPAGTRAPSSAVSGSRVSELARMEGMGEVGEREGAYWGKPLPLQRILSENSSTRPRGKVARAREGEVEEDKENTEEREERWPEEPMSSTVMDRSAAASTLFSTSDNLSSISLLAARAEAPAGQDKLFKTPKRREVVEEGTPASSRSSGSSLRTPSSGGRRSTRTPSSTSSGTRWNPFDSYDRLHQPTLSPGVFATVLSPSQDHQEQSGRSFIRISSILLLYFLFSRLYFRRFWSIEQQADMFPTDISDESPLKQSLYQRHHSRDLEERTQEQLELYFKETHAVTSPPDLPPTGPLLAETPSSRDASYSQADRRAVTAATQTTLTLPPALPEHLEALLRQFCTYQESEEPPPAALSNSTLRRKLFEAAGHLTDSEGSCSSRSPSPDSAPCSPGGPGVTPGRVIHTPSAAWSSSPVRRCSGRATSFSPPDQLGSPIFSPIVRGRVGGREEEEEEGAGSPVLSPRRPAEDAEDGNLTEDMTAGDTSLLYQTADSAEASRLAVEGMDTDSNSGPAWAVSNSAGYGWAASTAADGWTEHTREEASSRWTASLLPDVTADAREPSTSTSADTGYRSTDGCSAGTTGLASLAASMEAPSAIVLPAQPTDAKVLVSYAAESCHDISVGFPLGSSTPTKH